MTKKETKQDQVNQTGLYWPGKRTTDSSTKRRTMFDSLCVDSSRNMYCEKSTLDNEASVETFFVARMLKDLGYKDSQIKSKKSVSEIVVGVGSKRVPYKPDYVITFRGVPRWVLDAKGIDEPLGKWEPQCGGYCLALNQRVKTWNPVCYYVLCNGIETRVYKWDEEEPILSLSFPDFVRGHPLYEKLRGILSVDAIASTRVAPSVDRTTFLITRPTAEEARRIFGQCHNAIRKAEGYNPSTAFLEFTKLMFVKLWADRKLREDPSVDSLLREAVKTKVDPASVCFSVHWIEAQEKQTDNPINDILFRSRRNEIEQDIARGKRKRIFESGEDIGLGPDTMKGIVGRLEHYDMFGIDEDLNGRLFETFLSATMRGKQLGQFFTPRSIVKVMTRLAGLRASRMHMDKVIDACCGTGGFLIEALTDMRNKLRADRTLSSAERGELMDQLENECLFGIDFGKSPFIARIARINMYLHGDGGRHIYYGEGLDKSMEPFPGQGPEILRNQEELRDLIQHGLRFDTVLTNPPFAMTKELSNESEARILKQYSLAKFDPGSEHYRQSLRSSAMFLERYWELLSPGTNLLTIIDETLLSSGDYAFVRDFIRERFVIRAIISLHGDSFRMADSRVKTSILYLQRKKNLSDQQPAVFMYSSLRLGVDNLPPSSRSSQVVNAQHLAQEETDTICREFEKFQNGEEGPWLVDPSYLRDRLDVKFCVPMQGRFVPHWRRQGYQVLELAQIARPAGDPVDPKECPDEQFRLLQVTYAGRVKLQGTRRGNEIHGSNIKRVKRGQLVVSRYNAFHGAMGVVSEEFHGALASGSYIVLECDTEKDAVYLWSILRTTELRADILSPAIGLGRQTIKWKDIRTLAVPLLPLEERECIADDILSAWQKESEAEQTVESISSRLHSKFDVESEESKRRFEAHKPPR